VAPGFLAWGHCADFVMTSGCSYPSHSGVLEAHACLRDMGH
jgi:hypothetical protein